jgi:hypothetical protein
LFYYIPIILSPLSNSTASVGNMHARRPARGRVCEPRHSSHLARRLVRACQSGLLRVIHGRLASCRDTPLPPSRPLSLDLHGELLHPAHHRLQIPNRTATFSTSPHHTPPPTCPSINRGGALLPYGCVPSERRFTREPVMRRCVREERGNIWRKHHRWIVQRKLRGSKHPIDIFARSVAYRLTVIQQLKC